MVCVLFFCPYQVLFLKNRCCTTCRIYNWDYFMMCTPLIFVPHFFTWGLLALSVIILLKWEITALKFPERFCENTNDCLSCKNCQDKLCVNRSRFKKIINKRKPNWISAERPNPLLNESGFLLFVFPLWKSTISCVCLRS